MFSGVNLSLANLVSFFLAYCLPEGSLFLMAREIADIEISSAGNSCIISESEIDGE